MSFQAGQIINGNTVKEVIEHIVYFQCGRCGNPFEHGKARLRFRLPVSCGCEIKARHDRIMAGCFQEHRRGKK